MNFSGCWGSLARPRPGAGATSAARECSVRRIIEYAFARRAELRLASAQPRSLTAFSVVFARHGRCRSGKLNATARRQLQRRRTPDHENYHSRYNPVGKLGLSAAAQADDGQWRIQGSVISVNNDGALVYIE